MDKSVDAAVPAESAEDFGTDFEGIARRWNAEIKQARKARRAFDERGRRILRRYKLFNTAGDSGEITGKRHRFNILWSNLEILQPATYSKRPKALIKRRHLDADPVALCASLLLERIANYEIEHFGDLHEGVKAANRDRLLPGLGALWLRFEPTLRPIQISPSVAGEEVKSARTAVDYVNWADYLESPARTAEERRWIARRVPMTRSKLLARFKDSMRKTGAQVRDIPFDKPRKKDDESADPDQFFEVANVWEIWSRDDRQVIFQVENYKLPLEVRSDPLRLERFFPAPQPLLATVDGEDRIPTADYAYYEDHAAQLDDVTRRINLLQQAIRVAGFYDKSNDALKQFFDAAYQNVMIPVDNWQQLLDRGGIEGSIGFPPLLEQILKNLQSLYTAQQQIKGTIFEITGIADIVRGATVASETLGAQELKAKFANLRIQSRQDDIAAFVSETIALRCEIVVKHYPDEIILRRAAADQLPPDMQALVQPALALLRAEEEFCYRVDVASDSMVQLDYDNEKANRTELLNAVAQFVPQAMAMVESMPQAAPFVVELLKFGVRGFRVGREVELALERFGALAQQMAANPPPPKPDASMERVKVEAERLGKEDQWKQTELGLKSREIDLKYQPEAADPAEIAKTQQELALAAQKHDLELTKGQQELAMARDRHALELEGMRQQQALARDQAARDAMAADRESSSHELELERHSSDMASAAQQRDLAASSHALEAQRATAEDDRAEAESSATTSALTAAAEALTRAVEAIDNGPLAEAISKLADAMGAERELVEDPSTGAMSSRIKARLQ